MATDEIVDHTSDLIVRIPSPWYTLPIMLTVNLVLHDRQMLWLSQPDISCLLHPKTPLANHNPPRLRLQVRSHYRTTGTAFDIPPKVLRRPENLNPSNLQTPTMPPGQRHKHQQKPKQMPQRRVLKATHNLYNQPTSPHQQYLLNHLRPFMRADIALTFHLKPASYPWTLLYSIASVLREMIVSASTFKPYYSLAVLLIFPVSDRRWRAGR